MGKSTEFDWVFYETTEDWDDDKLYKFLVSTNPICREVYGA